MRSWVYNLGYARGVEEGRVQRMEESIERGRLEGFRESIEIALTARGFKLTAARRAQLEAESRVETLLRWLSRAVTAERTAQVFAER